MHCDVDIESADDLGCEDLHQDGRCRLPHLDLHDVRATTGLQCRRRCRSAFEVNIMAGITVDSGRAGRGYVSYDRYKYDPHRLQGRLRPEFAVLYLQELLGRHGASRSPSTSRSRVLTECGVDLSLVSDIRTHENA